MRSVGGEKKTCLWDLENSQRIFFIFSHPEIDNDDPAVPKIHGVRRSLRRRNTNRTEKIIHDKYTKDIITSLLTSFFTFHTPHSRHLLSNGSVFSKYIAVFSKISFKSFARSTRFLSLPTVPKHDRKIGLETKAAPLHPLSSSNYLKTLGSMIELRSFWQ